LARTGHQPTGPRKRKVLKGAAAYCTPTITKGGVVGAVTGTKRNLRWGETLKTLIGQCAVDKKRGGT